MKCTVSKTKTSTNTKNQWILWLLWTYLRKGNGTPLQYSCLENPMDGGAWKAAVHGVTEGRTQLSDFTFTFYFHTLEKEMATHSSVLNWRIPGTGRPGGLPSLGSHRVRHNWSDFKFSFRLETKERVSPGRTISQHQSPTTQACNQQRIKREFYAKEFL